MLKLPAEQITGAVEPVTHAWPAGQSEQVLCAVPPELARYVPAKQLTGALAPLAHQKPAGQNTQSVWPLND